jgi:hypothetical protein
MRGSNPTEPAFQGIESIFLRFFCRNSLGPKLDKELDTSKNRTMQTFASLCYFF